MNELTFIYEICGLDNKVRDIILDLLKSRYVYRKKEWIVRGETMLTAFPACWD